MKQLVITCALGLAATLIAGCSQAGPADSPAGAAPPKTEAKDTKAGATSTNAAAAASTETNTVNTNEVAVIKTTEGEMVVEFWPDVAPKTVENFKTLAKKGFYDGTCFHRVIKGFMIQGGDPLTKDPAKEASWGTGDPGYKIKAEFNERSHTRGVLSMARSQQPDSAGSQFFICHGNPTFLDRQYTAFGKLIKGDDVLEKIATTPTHPQDRPDKRMGVESIKIVAASSIK
ncbi:MAG: peptidylprolyl isomerase [Verrucomicrobia bacterium]|nr:peptidylprolyl isomerase [Verrucomicrobiota bacterium]